MEHFANRPVEGGMGRGKDALTARRTHVSDEALRHRKGRDSDDTGISIDALVN